MILPNKKTSKYAIYFLMWVVFAIAVMFMASGYVPEMQALTPMNIQDPHNDFINKFSEIGKASWYSKASSCHNPVWANGVKECLTANGDYLNEKDLTIAMMDVPFNTKVKITNSETHLSVIARVNDRGGFGKLGRIVDLNPRVKSELGCGDICTVLVQW